jgi:hypothetical protein
MDEEQEDGNESGKVAPVNPVIDHVHTATKALDKRDFDTANREILKAREETEVMTEKAVSESLASTQFKINYARNIGADVRAAEGLLRDAKAAQVARDLERALVLARQCRDEAERAKERYKELVDLIYEAESLISKAHVVGKDTSSAERHLANAVALKTGNGIEALAEASKARDEVLQALGLKSPNLDNPPQLYGDSSLDPDTRMHLQELAKGLQEMLAVSQQALSSRIRTSRTDRLRYYLFEELKGVDKKRAIDVKKATDLLARCRESLNEEIELANPSIRPELKLKGFFSKTLRYGDWNDALLVLQNTGETAALEVNVKLSGDIEMEAFPPFDQIAPGEKKALKVRLRARQMGELPVEIQISFKRAYDGKLLSSSAKSKIAVK